LALCSSGVRVELREISLREKPPALIAISPKATVPVLRLLNGTVLEESMDIIHWALSRNDPDNWLDSTRSAEVADLINQNDTEFKFCLDRYKYPERYPEQCANFYRRQSENFLGLLEKRLRNSAFLCGEHFSLADAAILPFIRQFAAVDLVWFSQSGYSATLAWLHNFIDSPIFSLIMQKYPIWTEASPPIVFPD
jgi:glutathione S-transferase